MGRNASDDLKADLSDVQAALNAVASQHGFRCVPVSWEDAQRGTVGGALSCWGGNISDVRLWAKDGTLLYTLRTDNWNERLGYVASKDVAVVTGNHVPGGEPYAPITLQKYLKNIKQYAGYAGVKSEQLWDETADQLLSIRFQAVFLPIKDEETSEFCTDVYNYNTHDDGDPRNALLLCTAQGTHVQQDGSGAKKLFIHNVDRNSIVHRYWLEAERSKHKVGGAQLETEEEAAAAAARGKATAMHIGTKAMGTRFNVQMLIQLPLKQKGGGGLADSLTGGSFDNESTSSSSSISSSPHSESSADDDDDDDCTSSDDRSFSSDSDRLDEKPSCLPTKTLLKKSAPMKTKVCDDDDEDGNDGDAAAVVDADSCFDDLADDLEDECCGEMDCGVMAAEDEKTESMPMPAPPPPPPCFSSAASCLSPPPPPPFSQISLSPQPPRKIEQKPKKKGTANAARVSRGTEFDTWGGVSNTEPVRDPSQHGTITVTLYYTVAGGVPSEADVEACVADLEALYKACPSDKKLVDCSEITAELTVKNMMDIGSKV